MRKLVVGSTTAQGVTLRPAREADIPALAALHVRAFRQTHGHGPDVTLRDRQWRGKFASGQLVFCIVVQDEAGDLVGFASGEMQHGPELSRYRGVLDKIYLLRDHQGHGFGRLLLLAAAESFLEAGVTSMLLFGDAKSPSNGFYERMGGERLYAPNGEFHGAYGWSDLGRVVALCSSDRGRRS